MRSIFIAVSKVFGLIQVYKGLLFLVGIVPMFQAIFFAPFGSRSLFGMPVLFGIGTILWSFVVTFGLAWLLIFKAEWLADKLRIPTQTEIDIPPRDHLLFIGVVLVGLYISVEGASQFGGAILNTFAHSDEVFSLHGTTPPSELVSWFFGSFLTSVLAPGLKLALGLVLVLKTRKVLSWITKDEPASGSPQVEANP